MLKRRKYLVYLNYYHAPKLQHEYRAHIYVCIAYGKSTENVAQILEDRRDTTPDVLAALPSGVALCHCFNVTLV